MPESDQSDQNKRPVPLTYTELLSRLSGFKLSTGYGTVTHFYNLHNNLTPASAVKICTIHDYIGMRLTGRKSPLIHSSDAASLGFFQTGRFDETALRKLLADDQNVYADQEDKELPAAGEDNIGGHFTKMEIRPLCTEKDRAEELRIAVGATLCGGKAYAVLENLFQTVIEMAGLKAELEKANGASLFPLMNELVAQAMKQVMDDSDQLIVSTRFSGTRENPQLRGSINNINMHSLDAQSLTLGVLKGIIEELHAYYRPSNKHRLLIGSGNALRRNPVLQQIAAKRFDLPLMIPAHKEEAAYGAALAALTGSGFCNSLAQAQSLIRYQEG
jgi:sedoheptulokinase